MQDIKRAIEEGRVALGIELGSTRIKAVLIGPEGGFSDEEIRLALEAGIRPVTLGKRILRTEPAAVFVLSAAGLLLEA